jgi:hypothetical protein
LLKIQLVVFFELRIECYRDPAGVDQVGTEERVAQRQGTVIRHVDCSQPTSSCSVVHIQHVLATTGRPNASSDDYERPVVCGSEPLALSEVSSNRISTTLILISCGHVLDVASSLRDRFEVVDLRSMAPIIPLDRAHRVTTTSIHGKRVIAELLPVDVAGSDQKLIRRIWGNSKP